ncbi:transposase [Streptacidiphilus sp. MAP5-3]|uniref:transposase n=2 Tax=Streptacidiphilus TaxID=228398 RepID=UPI003513B02B
MVAVAAGVFAPGHLGELTQIVDFALVDAALEASRAVWDKLTAGLGSLVPVRPHSSSLSRARRRLGPEPLRLVFEALAGAVAWTDRPGAWWCGMRTVAVDGTSLRLPDREPVTARFTKRHGPQYEFAYPVLRLITLVETGTRAVIAAAFGPEADGELVYATRLLNRLGARMLLLADAAFDAVAFLRDVHATGAHFLVRSTAGWHPTIGQRLPDGSYLSRLSGSYRAGRGYEMLTVRVIEAWITVTLEDAHQSD